MDCHNRISNSYFEPIYGFTEEFCISTFVENKLNIFMLLCSNSCLYVLWLDKCMPSKSRESRSF